MADFTIDQESLKQMIDMGIPRDKAMEALSKYNNDVGQAANFYFENSRTDPEEMPALGSLTDGWGVTTQITGSDNNDSDMMKAIEASKKDADNAADDEFKRAMDASIQDSQNMQVVLYNNNNKDDDDPQLQKTIHESYNDSNFSNSNQWTDPEQPMKRMNPIGLRPASVHRYANSFIQALFYIPAFRLSLLSFRPTIDDWGEVEGYWKGKRNSPSIESVYPENDRLSTLKFIHEFQKLFGFLSLSRRSYGDSSLLLETLNFKGKSDGWGDHDDVADFTQQLIDALLRRSQYRNNDIPDDILDFDKLFRSQGGSEVVRTMQLDITHNNTVYAALDHITQLRKVLFSKLAHILIINLKHTYSYQYSDSSFQIQKELYMDRYLSKNSDILKEKWNQVEDLKGELKRTSHQIDKIMKFQGKHSGSELLKGSVNYFKWKCAKAEEKGEQNDDSRLTMKWLDGVLTRVEGKLKILLERREELEQNIKNIFDTPDMKEHLYRLKAVLVCDGQVGQGNHWAYIWVPKDGKNDSYYPSTLDDGDWMKFCDTNVEQVYEDVVLNENTNSFHSNNTTYALIYVDHHVDLNPPNITDVIPASLKEFVDRDNSLLEEELFRSSREDMSESTVDPVEPMDQSNWGSDSTACGNSYEQENNEYSILAEQANQAKSYDVAILKRIELFGAKLGEVEAVKSLVTNHKLPFVNTLEWSDPIPLDDRYRENPDYGSMVKAYEEFKNITLCIIEGLEQSFQDQYTMGLGYFYRALEMERSWVNEIRRFGFDGTNLTRSEFINEFAKAFLKILNDGALDKARNPASFSIGVENALQVAKICGYFRLTKDTFFKELSEGWVALEENIREDVSDRFTYEKLTLLVSTYKSSEIPYGLDIPIVPHGLDVSQPKSVDDNLLVQRYIDCITKCRVLFKKVLENLGS